MENHQFLFSHFSSLKVKIKRKVSEMEFCKQLSVLSSGDWRNVYVNGVHSEELKGKQWEMKIILGEAKELREIYRDLQTEFLRFFVVEGEFLELKEFLFVFLRFRE